MDDVLKWSLFFSIAFQSGAPVLRMQINDKQTETFSVFWKTQRGPSSVSSHDVPLRLKFSTFLGELSFRIFWIKPQRWQFGHEALLALDEQSTHAHTLIWRRPMLWAFQTGSAPLPSPTSSLLVHPTLPVIWQEASLISLSIKLGFSSLQLLNPNSTHRSGRGCGRSERQRLCRRTPICWDLHPHKDTADCRKTAKPHILFCILL